MRDEFKLKKKKPTWFVWLRGQCKELSWRFIMACFYGDSWGDSSAKWAQPRACPSYPIPSTACCCFWPQQDEGPVSHNTQSQCQGWWQLGSIPLVLGSSHKKSNQMKYLGVCYKIILHIAWFALSRTSHNTQRKWSHPNPNDNLIIHWISDQPDWMITLVTNMKTSKVGQLSIRPHSKPLITPKLLLKFKNDNSIILCESDQFPQCLAGQDFGWSYMWSILSLGPASQNTKWALVTDQWSNGLITVKLHQMITQLTIEYRRWSITEGSCRRLWFLLMIPFRYDQPD